MATDYEAFTFVITFTRGERIGGFSDSSLLQTGKPRRGRPLSVQSVTLTRGVVNSRAMAEWLAAARKTAPGALRSVTITRSGEAGRPAQSWTLRGAMPVKYTGPALSATNSEVAMETLELSAEAIEPAG